MRQPNILRIGLMVVMTMTLILSLTTSTMQAAPTAAVDFVAYPMLEITQGVQNMYTPASGKQVPLVEGKRTYVILYATSTKDFAQTTGLLAIRRNGKLSLVLPLNPQGRAQMTTNTPHRVQGGAGRYVFEVPTNLANGTVSFQGILNPGKILPQDEANFNNNSSNEITVTFQPVRSMHLNLWDVQYKRVLGSRVYKLADLAPVDHRALAADWLKRAYPLNPATYHRYNHSIYMGRWANTGGKFRGYCLATNLAVLANTPSGEYGYGMVADSGGYMRGCSEPLTDRAASGPTGNTGDPDNPTYGDAYAGHELGHLFGRKHAAYCDAGIPKSSYPYPGGSISPVTTNLVNVPEGIIGFDTKTQATYSSGWFDIMSYCGPRWLSDISYKQFFQHIKSSQPTVQKQSTPGVVQDRLLVRGALDPETNQITVRPSFVVTQSVDTPHHQPGDYAIVLRNQTGTELERYQFTMADEAAVDEDEGGQPGEADTLRFFQELVPYHADATRVEVVGPDNAVLATVMAGTSAPSTTMLTGNSTTRIPPDQTELGVQWQGADQDGDQVYYVMQYSNDGGATWLSYTDTITETEVTLPQENLMAGNQVQLRVIATDGIHSSTDTNDSSISVLNHPPTVRIIPPTAETLAAPTAGSTTAMTQTTFALSQTVTLNAEAYDIEIGSLEQELTWSSNLAGELQTGSILSTSELGIGQHVITVTADDGQGAIATDSITVTIVPSLDDLPAAPDRLMVDATNIGIHSTDAPTATVAIHNQNAANTLDWTATVDQPWLQLSQTSGTTPNLLTITVAPDAPLLPGVSTATITLTSPATGQQETIEVDVTIPGAIVYLPSIMR